MIGSKALPRSIRLAVTHFLCSTSLITIAWSQSLRPGEVVVGRIQIPTVTEPLKLAEPNPISLQSNGQKVTYVTARWGYYARGIVMHPVNEDDDILPVSYDSTGGASVNVTPRKLGKVQLMLFISFEDGRVERKKIDLQVGQSAGPPEKLVITFGGRGYGMDDTPVLYLDLSEADRTTHVFPAAIYKNATNPIPLNASDMTFKLINSLGAAEIDPSTGIVTARHVGQVQLETSFRGVSTLTCIDVMNDVRVGPRSRCEELQPPGRSLPPSLKDLDSAPPPRVKALPR